MENRGRFAVLKEQVKVSTSPECLVYKQTKIDRLNEFSAPGLLRARPILAALFTFLDRQTLENINNCPEAKCIYQKS